MISIKELYKIGPGPSSSHTIGPKKAVEYILNKYPDLDYCEMTFYGSLAETGKGHLSDYIASRTFGTVKHQILFDYKTHTKHPNTMVFKVYKENKLLDTVQIISVGGGLIKVKNEKLKKDREVYEESSFDEIKAYCLEHDLSLIDYIYLNEGESIYEYGKTIYDTMLKSVESGLNKEGLLPGKLKVKRKAKDLYNKVLPHETSDMKEKRLISAYAFAVSEENASGQMIVTAPTCGASGILPSLLRYKLDQGYKEKELIESLLVAGLIGVIVKTNASISGAECGCQAEVGTASSMGAAFLANLEHLGLKGIERASEIALEHSLGLTCDPIDGYVQIPCIERNAMGAIKSIMACSLSELMGSSNSKISFDVVVKTMYQTGKDLNRAYRETSLGGLAKIFKGE